MTFLAAPGKPWATLLITVLCCTGCQEEWPDLSIGDLEVIDNPNSTLSCVVRWTTPEPASSLVRFGETGTFSFVVENPEWTTEHELTLIGMRPEREHQLQAVSSAGDVEETSETLQYTTGALPFPSVEADVAVLDEGAMQPGWTLVNLAVGEVITRTVAVALDHEGQVVWYHVIGESEGRADVEVSLLEDDRVLIGGAVPPGYGAREVDLAGNVLWEGPEQVQDIVEEDGMHHAFRKLSNGNYLALFFGFQEPNLYDEIREFDASHEVVWSWNTLESLPWDDHPAQGGNTATADLDEDVVYYNDRLASTFYKIDRSSGDVLWAFGQGGDFTVEPDVPAPWFVTAHAPERLGNGNILLFDNGDAQQRPVSRVMEYEIDEAGMSARVAWEYPGALAQDEWFTPYWGDADRLDNGNTLVVAGNVLAAGSQSRIFEVTQDGTMVWEMWQAASDGDVAGSYMATRIPELVQRIE